MKFHVNFPFYNTNNKCHYYSFAKQHKFLCVKVFDILHSPWKEGFFELCVLCQSPLSKTIFANLLYNIFLIITSKKEGAKPTVLHPFNHTPLFIFWSASALNSAKRFSSIAFLIRAIRSL